jgi:hypothetical protein
MHHAMMPYTQADIDPAAYPATGNYVSMTAQCCPHCSLLT